MRRPELWAELMELTPAERLDLVEDLWDSIAPENLPPLSPEEIDELKRELADHQAEPTGAQPWETVRAWLWSRRK
jgi:putative addiction module component (TIGR02574 family)